MVHVLKEIQEVFQHKAKALYLEHDSKIGRYKRALTALHHLQEKWPQSVDLARRAIDVRKKIVDLQLQRPEFWYHKSFARWSRQAYKPHPTNMRHFDGCFTSDVVEMRDIASTFYHNLLTAAPLSRNSLIKREYVWASVSNRVSLQMQTILLAPLQPSEVLRAAKALGKDVFSR